MPLPNLFQSLLHSAGFMQIYVKQMQISQGWWQLSPEGITGTGLLAAF